MEKRQLIEEIKLQDFFLLVSFPSIAHAHARRAQRHGTLARRGYREAHAQKKDKAGDGGRGRERAEDQRDARASWLVTSSRAGEWIAPSPTP